ncbi:MAG: ORF6N domain-containing protein [Bacteroidota bacterium]
MKDSKSQIVVYDSSLIQNQIYTIHGIQVMLDSDLAELYQVETKVFNQAVKRNIKRFPDEFRFQLTEDEYNTFLRSQSVTLKKEGRGKHRKYLPYVFTEQGVSMLSAVLKSDLAIEISIKIINAFVEMRRYLVNNANLFQHLDNIERKHYKLETETNKKFEHIFNALQSKELEPKQGIFFNGQIFDAYKFVSGLIRRAKKSIILIDNYIDETILDLLSKKKKKVAVTIFTSRINKALLLDMKKFNEQYPILEIKKFSKSHDRFLIIDDKDVYHFGASLKDLGKKWFAFSKMEKSAFEVLENIEQIVN